MPKAVKEKSIYVCENCGNENAKWLGQCPSCGEWNTYVETVKRAPVSAGKGLRGNLGGGFGATTTSRLSLSQFSLDSVGVGGYTNFDPQAFRLSKIKKDAVVRTSSGIEEFDRVLGGGFVGGQTILISGEPGIGKSTLLTQIIKSMSEKYKDNFEAAYICGEENPGQIKLRAERLNLNSDSVFLIPETNVETVVDILLASFASQSPDKSQTQHGKSQTSSEKEKSTPGSRARPRLIIVDSVQTLTSGSLTGSPGSISQLRHCTQILVELSKALNVPIILVGHVTKEGVVAGPKVLEHIVDTVLILEGDSQHVFRILRTTKNRFGAVSEVGIFEMSDEGLLEVKNPSQIFLQEHESNITGSCKTVVMEGQRPLIFEVQALTTKTSFGYPRRTASGFSNNRLLVLIAVIEKRTGLDLSNLDVYLNVAGGFKITEFSADLAVCLAIISSARDKAINSGVTAFGEIGLLGEIRRVTSMSLRQKEAQKMGYKNVISADSSRSLKDAVQKAFKA